MNQQDLKIFAGANSEKFAIQVANHLGVNLGNLKLQQFSDGEFIPVYEDNLRGGDVFLIQSTCPPSDNLMELLLMIDAAKRASAGRVTAVIPYFGWARQDRKDRPRVPIGAKVVANLLTAVGCDRIITCDLHADQIQGFFDIPLDHISAKYVLVPEIKKLNLSNLVVATPDIGGSKRASAFAKLLECPFVICHKQRTKANVVDSMMLIGDVKDKHVVLVDDMVDTAGTLCKAAKLIRESGALSVRACVTHGVLSGEAYERIESSLLSEIIVTDSIPNIEQCDYIRQVSLTEIFAKTINFVHENESTSSIFEL